MGCSASMKTLPTILYEEENEEENSVQELHPKLHEKLKVASQYGFTEFEVI